MSDHTQEEDRLPGFVRGSDTSEAAARSMRGDQRKQQGLMVLQFYRFDGKDYTSDDVLSDTSENLSLLGAAAKDGAPVAVLRQLPAQRVPDESVDWTTTDVLADMGLDW